MSAIINGGFGRNWTTDTRIFSPLLYRLSYEAKKMAVPTGFGPAIFCVTGRRDNHYTTEPIGCGGRIWTIDLWVMSPTSYQTAPLRDINKNKLAEKEGFEPPRRRRPPGFQDQSLQPDLGISPCFLNSKHIVTHYKRESQYFFIDFTNKCTKLSTLPGGHDFQQKDNSTIHPIKKKN